MNRFKRMTIRRGSLRRGAGLSLVELLIALAITATLLAATMVAVNASFIAYASAAEESSAQASLRMVMHRLIQLIRTSTLHEPMGADYSSTPPVTISGNTITSHYLRVIDPDGNDITISYDADTKTLNYTILPLGGDTAVTQPMLGGVSSASFVLTRRRNDQGLYILDRATVDITVEVDPDATLSIENSHRAPIRLVASTNPRKLD